MKTKLVGVIVGLMAAVAALQAQTTQQAEAGRALFQARCASCHATDLGGGEGPQLAGANFIVGMGNAHSS